MINKDYMMLDKNSIEYIRSALDYYESSGLAEKARPAVVDYVLEELEGEDHDQ